ncbi:uncharacterized protein LOC121372256 [Gigantopelta aegis]|uniref:uncharacterized protein LOC121372256 n=1 Tax=Gigantopelta aegis TaxID=1735272 RepID=UPI001B88A05B|nr:uncharacterized protein LOC121372256 [Gigantopelta aegis]
MSLHTVTLFKISALIPLLVVAVEVHHRALNLPPDVVHTVHNVHHCYNLCVVRTTCVAYNYDIRNRECELFFSTNGGSLEFKQNSIYQDVPDGLSHHGSQPCNTGRCGQNEMCANTQDKNYQCLPLDICAAGTIWSSVDSEYIPEEAVPEVTVTTAPPQDCSSPGVTYLPGATCKEFIQCNAGQPVTKRCGIATKWDQSLLACVGGTC